jgi:PAT family beta-lactamase induction signal transducer AmpG
MNSLKQTVFSKKMGVCLLAGFSSGLPLFILLSLIPAWLRIENIDLKIIGLFSLIQIPYTWKFIWAPIFDAYSFKFGRRKSWLLIFQILLLFSVALVGQFSPETELIPIVILSTLIACFSASQDIVIDALRREILLDHELGLGNAIHVNSYKISSLIPGSLSLILADQFSWQFVFISTALFMLLGIFMTFWVKEPIIKFKSNLTLKNTMAKPFQEFFKEYGYKQAMIILLFIFLYKLGDSMATSLATPFYIDMNYSMTEIGLIAKNAGLWSSVIGGILGGIWMIRLGINKALWIFGFFQMFAILPFAYLSIAEKNLLTLGFTVGFEAFAVGLGTTVFVSYIAKTTNPKYTATQFALFTSLASIPRSITNASSGFVVESIGWTNFFYVCFVLAIPGMLLLKSIAPYNSKS